MNVKKLVLCIALPLGVGALSSLASMGNNKGQAMFEQLTKPPLSPPGWIFPVVCTILFVLMGIASSFVLGYMVFPFSG